MCPSEAMYLLIVVSVILPSKSPTKSIGLVQSGHLHHFFECKETLQISNKLWRKPMGQSRTLDNLETVETSGTEDRTLDNLEIEQKEDRTLDNRHNKLKRSSHHYYS